MTPPTTSSVAVLLCTFQGQDFLVGQLDSIAAQTHRHWSVWASDDGSSDGTVATLERYRATWGADRLSIVTGPARGPDANFLSLAARPDIQADYCAFADQDDVWEMEKLARAIARLAAVAPDRPALYGSRTRLIDAAGAEVGLSPLFSKPPRFRNALAQNIAGGNTMVFNRAARELLVRAHAAGCNPVTYDWWTYLLVTGAGGEVFYDSTPMVRYRQHARNYVGANVATRDRLRNLGQVSAGRLRRWNDVNLAALARVRSLLTADNQRAIDWLEDARRGAMPARLAAFHRSGVRRQTAVGNVVLWIAAAAGRL